MRLEGVGLGVGEGGGLAFTNWNAYVSNILILYWVLCSRRVISSSSVVGGVAGVGVSERGVPHDSSLPGAAAGTREGAPPTHTGGGAQSPGVFPIPPVCSRHGLP